MLKSSPITDQEPTKKLPDGHFLKINIQLYLLNDKLIIGDNVKNIKPVVQQ